MAPVFTADIGASSGSPFIDPFQRIVVTASGHGPDVVLLAGLASSNAIWDAVLAQLRARFRVHAVQIAGFGGTAPGRNIAGPVLEPASAAIRNYFTTCAVNAPALVGHSLGGLIALKLVIDDPAIASRLMLVDALPFYGMLAGPDATAANVEPQAAALREKLLAGTQDEFTAQAPANMRRLIKSSGRAATAAIRAASSSDARVVAQAMYDDFVMDLRPSLPGVALPATILYAWDAASLTQRDEVDTLYANAYAALPQARLQRIEQSFHFVMLDQPAVFAAAVEDFLTGHETAKRPPSAGLRKNAAAFAIELLVNVGLPFLIYGYAGPHLGEVDGLLAASTPPIAWSLVEFGRHRRVDAISMLTIGGITLSLLAFLGGGSARLLQLREKLVTGVIGIFFLVSAVIGRPVIFEMARAGMRRKSAADAARFDALQDRPDFRRATTLLTIVWGVGLLADVAVSAVLVYRLSIRAYLVVNPFLGYATMGGLSIWTFWFARRHGLIGRRD